jgi:hypothetical protein
MNWNKWIRTFHRWIAMAFVATVVITSIALAQPEPLIWISYVPLLPLALLALSGIYLFVLPYVLKRRSGSTSP